jgi:hypothetical protein
VRDLLFFAGRSCERAWPSSPVVGAVREAPAERKREGERAKQKHMYSELEFRDLPGLPAG